MTDERSAAELERFRALTVAHLAAPLLGRYALRSLDGDAWTQVYGERVKSAFPHQDGVDFPAIYGAESMARADALTQVLPAQGLTHKLAFVDLEARREDGDGVCGCFWGTQEQWGNRYYMVFTMIDPSHQGRGIYGAFLQRLIPLLREIGFWMITSRHEADNNPVLVPKLKAGFLIKGFEISARYGLLIHLRYPLNERLRDVLGYRVNAVRSAAGVADVVRERPTPE